MKLTPLVVIALGALIAAPVYAADQTILGSTFQVKNPGTAGKRKVQVKAREKVSPNPIVGNPVVNGATITVRVAGGTPSQQVISLPQGTSSNGKPFWSGDAIKGFKYKDSKREQSAVKSVRLRKSGSGTVQLQAQLDASVQPPQAVTVLPPNPGTDACVLLEIGSGDSYSVKFTGGQIVNKADKEYTHKKVTTEGSCVPTCTDGAQNGLETDVDCGGPDCSDCGPGDSCSVPSDCDSGVCASGVCQGPTCTDGAQNGDETDIDCGGSCPADCEPGQGCAGSSDCVTSYCTLGLCKCPGFTYTFTVNSNVGGAVDSAEWPGGAAAQSTTPSCVVTVALPNDNVDLVCSLADPFSVQSFSGYSSCVGTGGEDGDGCAPLTCPPAGIGSCCDGRPSCSSGLNGSASANYFVQCSE